VSIGSQTGVCCTVLCLSVERVPRAMPRAPTAISPGPDVEAAYHPPVRAPWGRPRRTALLTLSLCATCTPAAPATQRRCRRTRAAPPLVGNWPSRLVAHPRPYRDLVRSGPSRTAFTDAPGHKDPTAVSPRAQEPSHGRAAAPPVKPHGELYPLVTCATNTYCSYPH
jgi:hypothetical protein